MTIYNQLPAKCPADKTIIALGIFDGLHLGHMAVLNALVSAANDYSPCVFTFDTNDARPSAKTNLHLLSGAMRDKIFENIGISYVFIPKFSEFRGMTPKAFSQFLTGYLNAKSVFCGENFRFGKDAAATASDLKMLLGGLAEVNIIKTVRKCGGDVSTSRIRTLIEQGDIITANTLLGRRFAIDFKVEHGRSLGRTLGLPTINQPFPHNFVVPRFGVYASETMVSGKRYPSVTNIGVKPTVGSDRLAAETFIFDFSGDLYGQSIPVSLIDFIRPETKFQSISELKAQIEADCLTAKKVYNSLQ